MTTKEAIERCKALIAEEKMLGEQKAILQGEKFADTVPSVKTVIDDIDAYVAKIPGAIKETLESAEDEKPAAPKFTAKVVELDSAQALGLILKLAGLIS